MSIGLIFLGLFLVSIVQVAYPQSLTDSINNAVEKNIKSTFDSINHTSTSSSNLPSGIDNDSKPTFADIKDGR